jgi:hypothetical protein
MVSGEIGTRVSSMSAMEATAYYVRVTVQRATIGTDNYTLPPLTERYLTSNKQIIFYSMQRGRNINGRRSNL